jgi:hypothetical protein
MVEGRALTTPALQDAPSPFGRLAGPRWVNSEELFKVSLPNTAETVTIRRNL